MKGPNFYLALAPITTAPVEGWYRCSIVDEQGGGGYPTWVADPLIPQQWNVLDSRKLRVWRSRSCRSAL